MAASIVRRDAIPVAVYVIALALARVVLASDTIRSGETNFFFLQWTAGRGAHNGPKDG